MRQDNNSNYLQSILDAMPNRVLLLDANGVVLLKNRSWQGLMEVEAGMSWLEYLESGEANWLRAKEVAQGIRAVIAGERSTFRTEGSYRTPDKQLWFDIRVTPLADEQVMVRYEDISERKMLGHDHFFELSPNMLCVADFNGYFRRINPAVENILGYTPEEMMAKPFIEWVHPDDIEATVAEVKRLESGAPTLDFHNRYLCRDGYYKWISWTAAKCDGLMYCAAHDITELKENQEALSQSERWMRTLTETMPQLVFSCRPDGWNTYFNQGWVDYTGLSLEESHGHGWTQVFHPDDQSAGTHAKQLGEGYEVESRLRGKNGEYRWFLIRGLPVKDATGAVECWLGTCTDIEDLKRAERELSEERAGLERRVSERTADMVWANEKLRVELAERKRTEDALRDAQEMLQIVMNHIPQAIFWKDLNCVYLGCNNKLAQDAGFDIPAQVVGKTCFDMPWAEHAPGYQKDDREVMASDKPKLNIEEPLVTGEGKRLWLRTNKIPLHNQVGEVVGVLGSYEDITVQKEAIEALREAKLAAERANEAKSVFLSRMSHELRTPLNAILGFGQLLEMGGLGTDESEFVAHILKSGRHLLSLINEILDIARVEAGRADFSIEPVCLGQAIGESCAMLLPLAAQANISFNVERESIDSTHVMADVQRLKQVAINLLSNGVKYNREGGRVDISCESTPQGNTRILFKDTGRGISPEDMEKLFTPFQRLDADSQSIEGSGLGLVLSRNLVEAMGGTLTMESVVGEGSTFIIELPTATSLVDSLERPATVCRDLVPVETGRSTRSVLCIEDNMANLHLVEHILASRPELKLLTAMQGSVGLDLAWQHKPDLILLDLDLPDISGKEVLAKLRENEVTRNIPVIMVTADATRPQAEFLMAAGAQAYLTKPLDIPEFLATIERILGGDWQIPLAS